MTPYALPLPPLTAPIWAKQPEETPQAHDAFLGWLMGGAHVRDWSAAESASGLPRPMLEQLFVRWVWEVRAKEWIAACRRAQLEATAPLRDELSAVLAVRLKAHRLALELECLELEKLTAKAKGELGVGVTNLPSALDPRELATLRRVNVQAQDALRREADGLPPIDTGPTATDWSKFSPDELEDYRRMRDKAGVR